jgi:hypothetical protein
MVLRQLMVVKILMKKQVAVQMMVWTLLSEFAAVGVFGSLLGDVGAGDDAADAGDGADSIKLF